MLKKTKMLKRFCRPKSKSKPAATCLYCGRKRAPNVPFCQADWERIPSYLRRMILSPEKGKIPLETLCASGCNYLRAVDMASEDLRNEEPPAVKRRYFNPSRSRWEYEDGTPVESGRVKAKPRDVIIPFGEYRKNGLHEAAEIELSTRTDRENPKGHPTWTNGKGRL
jgi:hypothetical protein